MDKTRKSQIEFGDFQTPRPLADKVCRHLTQMGIQPDILIEPTCGLGTFLQAGAENFKSLRQVFGFDANKSYIEILTKELSRISNFPDTNIEHIDFFKKDWNRFISSLSGRLLVVGNLPWVTSAGLGAIGGKNIPKKSNFLGMRGFDAISGKSNFDISEWMFLDILRCLSLRGGDIALLVKTSVARKILAHAEREKISVVNSKIIKIDAKKYFSAAVDACLMVMQIEPTCIASYDCTVFSSFDDEEGQKIGRRNGLAVSDIRTYDKYRFFLGKSPEKWRSGIKHDASKVMELTRVGENFENGLGEQFNIEPDFLFPLMKGSDVGSCKPWRNKFILVTQRAVGENTNFLKTIAPQTWKYLEDHAKQLDARASSIYVKNPRFSIFGIGDYAFRPWRIAICSLYKHLGFRLIGPIENRPVMFDDTVYYLSFENKNEAQEVLAQLQSDQIIDLLSSLIFWDEKRPIKTSILNLFDWSKMDKTSNLAQLELTI